MALPTPQFWSLWEQFSDGVQRATWLANIDNRHSAGREMISTVFLSTGWKESARHWRSVEDQAWHLHSLLENMPSSSVIIDAYVQFLYHIGEKSLPAAFIRVANYLHRDAPLQMLSSSNTVFLLETLLERYVYGRPLELKSENDLREAVLYLLDLLVENGSSAAFRMRDDFVTPISAGAN